MYVCVFVCLTQALWPLLSPSLWILKRKRSTLPIKYVPEIYHGMCTLWRCIGCRLSLWVRVYECVYVGSCQAHTVGAVPLLLFMHVWELWINPSALCCVYMWCRMKMDLTLRSIVPVLSLHALDLTGSLNHKHSNARRLKEKAQFQRGHLAVSLSHLKCWKITNKCTIFPFNRLVLTGLLIYSRKASSQSFL